MRPLQEWDAWGGLPQNEQKKASSHLPMTGRRNILNYYAHMREEKEGLLVVLLAEGVTTELLFGDLELPELIVC